MTTILSRRSLLRSTALIPAALALNACTSTGGLNVSVTLPPELTQAITYANDVIGKLDSLRSALPANVQALIDKGKAFLAAIQAATDATTIQGILAGLLPLVQQVLSFIPASSNTSTGGVDWSSIVAAVQTVLPIIAQIVGVVLPLFGARAARQMSLDQAFAILRSR